MRIYCGSCERVNEGTINKSLDHYKCGYCGSSRLVALGESDNTPVGSIAVGAGVGACLGGPVGAVVGGTLGWLFGRRG